MATSTTLPTSTVTLPLGGVSSGPGSPLGSTGWQAFVVDSDGTLIRELDVVGWGRLTMPLDGPRRMPLVLARANTADLAEVIRGDTEEPAQIQVYFDGIPLLWGVALTWAKSTAGADVPVSVVERARWLLGRRRNRRGAGLLDLLRNGGFESGKGHWSGAGSIDTTRHYAGAQSLLIDNPTGTCSQKFVVDRAVTVVVSARVRVDSSTWVGPNDDGTGIEVYVAPWSGYPGGDKFVTARLDASTPRGQWVTLTCPAVEIPDGYWDVWVRLRGIDGEVNYDGVSAQLFPRPRRTEAAGIFPAEDIPQIDQGRLVREVLASNLDGTSITVAVPDTGVMMDDEPGTLDDRYLGEVIGLVEQRESGMAFSYPITATTVTIRGHYPASTRGTAHTFPLCTDPADNTPDGANVAAFTVDGDLTAARNLTVLIGDGGFTGEASDPSAWGGLVLEEIVRAAGATPIEDLAGVAREHLRSGSGATTVIRATTHEAANDLIGVLNPGDTIVAIDDDTGLNDTVRVVSIEIDPVTLTMSLQLNLAV